jgi:hypothetical protein
MGIPEHSIQYANPANLQLLQGISRSLTEQSWAYGIGLRGMGGECLCQIYLSAMYDHFIQNKWVQENTGKISWKFWEIHIGDVDIEHRELTQAAINDLIRRDPSTLPDLMAGYIESKQAWSLFWRNIYEDAHAINH